MCSPQNDNRQNSEIMIGLVLGCMLDAYCLYHYYLYHNIIIKGEM